MPDGNVDLLRSQFLWWAEESEEREMTTFFRDDSTWAQVRAAFEPFVEPDCEFAWIAGDARMEHRGLEGLRAGWLDWYAPWASYRSRIEDVVDLGEDRVLVLVHERARRGDSSADVEMRPAALCEFQDGKLGRIHFYARREEAFEAAGRSAE